jgi:outer membrane lipoprotein-sorting protein
MDIIYGIIINETNLVYNHGRPMTRRNFSIFFLCLICLIPSLGFPLDIWQKYAKLKKLSANFSQTKELKNIGVTLKSSGTIHFERPNLFEWKVESPKNFVFQFKDDNISLMEDGKVIKNADTAKFDKKMLDAISHLKAWMMIDQKFIEDNYMIRPISSTVYEFTPKLEAKMFKSILIELGKDAPIKKISLTEISNDLIVIEFSKSKLTYEK